MGHHKVWALYRLDGVQVSPSTVERIMHTVSSVTPRGRAIAALLTPSAAAHVTVLATGPPGSGQQQPPLPIGKDYLEGADNRHGHVVAHHRPETPPIRGWDRQSWAACPHPGVDQELAALPTDHALPANAGPSWPT